MNSDWRLTSIGEAADFTSKPRGRDYSSFEQIPFVPMELVPTGSTYLQDHVWKSGKDIRSGNYFEKGDCLLARITPCFENGKQGIARDLPADFGVASTELIPFRGRVGISNKYFLFYSLLEATTRRQIAQKMEGATGRQRIPMSVLKNWPITLPPLPEQKKIAAVLFKIQKAVETQESIIRTMRELRKATMEFIFTHGLRGEKTKMTEIGKIPESWEIMPICKCYHFTKKPRELKYTDYDEIAFIPMDLIPNSGIYSRGHIMKKWENISSGTYFESGDMLIPKITPCFENEKQCVIREIPNGFGIATTEVIPIKEIPELSDKYFLFYYLLRHSIRSYIAGKMEGATGRQRVSVHLLREFMIPFPKMEEQKEIAKTLVTMDEKINIHQVKTSALRDIFKTVLNKLMTGELCIKRLDMDVSKMQD